MNEKAVQAQNTAFALPELKNLFYCRLDKEAHYQVARWLIEKEGIITHLESDTVYFYNKKKGIYEQKGRARIKEILTKTFTQDAKRHAQAEIINHVVNLTLKDEKEFERNTPKNKIPVKNGLVDIETGRLEPFNKNYWFTHQIPIIYDPTAKCEKITSFFLELVEEKDLTRLFDMFGLAIYYGYILEKFYILDGSGANGKSKFLKLLECFVGQENTSTITLQQLTEDKFAPANTHNKLLNIGADIGSRPIYDTAFLKNITGGERVTLQFKNGQPFGSLPTALFVFSSNKPPSFADDSDGMYRRPELIEFPNTFGNKADIAENPNIKPADPHILDKVTDGKELSGLFNVALEHLQNIIRTGELSVQQSTQQLRKQYLRISNSVHAFVNECCEPDEYHPATREGNVFIEAQGCVSVEEFAQKYTAWCKQEGLTPESADWIPRRLKTLTNWFLETGLQDHYGYWGKKKKSIRGIRVREHTIPDQTHHSPNKHTKHTIPFNSDVIQNVKGKNKGFAVFGVFEKPQNHGVLSTINTPFAQTHQINNNKDVLKFIQTQQKPVSFQEILNACPHPNAEKFITAILEYHEKRGDVYQHKPDVWGAT